MKPPSTNLMVEYNFEAESARTKGWYKVTLTYAINGELPIGLAVYQVEASIQEEWQLKLWLTRVFSAELMESQLINMLVPKARAAIGLAQRASATE